MCYGAPFIVAFVYLFVNTKGKGSVYGPATLWCWVDIDWVDLRIATVYAPAWCCILVSFCIYVMAGREIFTKRQQLRAFSHALPDSHPLEDPFTDFKTTEIQITSELATLNASETPKVFLFPNGQLSGTEIGRSPSGAAYKPYTVVIDSAPMSPRAGTMSPTGEKVSAPAAPVRKYSAPPPKASQHQRNNRAALEANAAAWGYTKVALLFFISLLITWVSSNLLSIDFQRVQGQSLTGTCSQVPSSVNRVYSLIHPELVSLPFTFASGIVLPLMGFWNSVIYITTSWKAVKLLITGRLPRNPGHSERSGLVNKRHSVGTRRIGASSGSESVRGFAGGGDGGGYNQV